MTASLISIFGPLKGLTLPLTEAEVTIGRDSSNSVHIPDLLLSRRHCKIHKEGDHYRIVDLKSRNGIFVNSLPTSGTILQDGDEIEIGDSLFLFLINTKDQTTKSNSLDEDIISTSTNELRLEDALYVRPERLLKGRHETERAVHDLAILLKISSIINSIQDEDVLQQKLLELIFDEIPADRAAILQIPDDKDEMASFSMDRDGNRILNPQISKDIVLGAIEQQTAVCNSVIPTDKTIRKKHPIQSILCVPLVLFQKVIGVLYLDSEDHNVFNDVHLQLACGISAIASIALKNINERRQLIEQNEELQAASAKDMIGESLGIQKIQQMIAKAAPKDSTVLICGESGTGKELIARAIHMNSARASSPFLAINCASLTETLLESELFGHEKGAFTGAIALKKGKLEVAEGGTIFLDEVSEISTSVQAKLLRVIQEREFERIGGIKPIKLNVRFIAASNRNLDQAIRQGTFRQDLFYRLNVIRIDVSPLRERQEDISLLAKYFILKYSKLIQRRVKGITPEALECLLEHDWPGNVRELENLIERAVVLGSTNMILPEDLPESMVENSPKVQASFVRGVKESKKKIVMNALKQSGGNYSEAAKILGVHPNYFYRLLRSLGLDK